MTGKLRSTLQKEIIEKHLNQINTFFTAEELHERVAKTHPRIGIATVYRFLRELKENNKIFSYSCNRKTVYSNENKSHCHFICEKTGKITHFSIDSLDFLKDKVPGSITSFQIEVKGICKDNCKKCSGKN